MEEEDKKHFKANQKYWNDRVPFHLSSEFYDVAAFLDGKSSLNPIELTLLGDLNGKSLLHLQCHFGQDSLSMARMGAKVVGVDISDAAIIKAREMAAKLELDASFIVSNVLQVEKKLNDLFDLVFTSYGTIIWLPDLNQWAQQIAKRLRPGGKFVMVDFHPVVNMLDDESMSKLTHPYFNRGLIAAEEFGSYAEPEADLHGTYATWNHSLSDIWNALFNNGLKLSHFEEHDSSPYPCYPNMTEDPGMHQIKGLEGKIPMLYSLVAEKA